MIQTPSLCQKIITFFLVTIGIIQKIADGAAFIATTILTERIVNLITGKALGEVGQSLGRKPLLTFALCGYFVSALFYIIGFLGNVDKTYPFPAKYKKCITAAGCAPDANEVTEPSLICKDGDTNSSLLVMATGSGKTRTAAAIVDMLTKCDWAKRVLFLADRNALVTQAKNAFKEHLEDFSSIDLTKEKEDSLTRLVFSTYPTIINKIDKPRNEDKRFYGVGHFDLYWPSIWF